MNYYSVIYGLYIVVCFIKRHKLVSEIIIYEKRHITFNPNNYMLFIHLSSLHIVDGVSCPMSDHVIAASYWEVFWLVVASICQCSTMIIESGFIYKYLYRYFFLSENFDPIKHNYNNI